MSCPICPALLAALLPALAALAQHPAGLVARLAGEDEIAAERALRDLCALPVGELPVAALRDAVQRKPTHGAALLVLAHHGIAEAGDSWLGDLQDETLAVIYLAPRTDAEVRSLLADASAPPVGRRAALFALQDRSVLNVDDVMVALDDDDALAGAALRVLRWEWPELPAELLRRLRIRPIARSALLATLAEAPRPGARAWAAGCAADAGLDPSDRLAALAATGADLDREQARFALGALMGDDPRLPSAFSIAAVRIPAAIADGLVGEAHRLCAAGLDPNRLVPFLERLSPQGEVQLLGLVAALDERARDVFTIFLAQRGSKGLQERVRSALDGEIPLEPHLLPRATALLDRPVRIDRVRALLADPVKPDAARVHAYGALVSAQVWTADVLDFARDDPTGGRWLQLLQAAVGPMSAGLLREAMDLGKTDESGDPRFVQRLWRAGEAALSVMERHGVPPELERVLLDQIAGAGQDGMQQRKAVSACRALALGGSEAAAHELWKLVGDRQQLRDDVLEWFAVGRRPWAHALLLAVLAEQQPKATEERRALCGRVRAILVELGDRRELADLLTDAPSLAARWLRRARRSAPCLTAEQALALLAAVPTTADTVTAAEMVAWAANHDDPRVRAELLALTRHDEPELQEAALRGLMAGPGRAGLLADLDQAMADGALDEVHELMAYEAIATVPRPPTVTELRRMARLYLELPTRAADRELAQALHFANGRAGFPMAGAIVHALREQRLDAVGPAFSGVAAGLLDAPALRFLSRQRLLCLWHHAAGDRALQQALGRAVAPLLVAIPDPRGTGDGPAALFAAGEAEQRGDFPRAAALYQRAATRLLRGGSEALAARSLLGERDTHAEVDPFAALAAAPWLCRAEARLRAGDPAAARRLLQTALDLGWSDLETRTRATLLLDK